MLNLILMRSIKTQSKDETCELIKSNLDVFIEKVW